MESLVRRIEADPHARVPDGQVERLDALLDALQEIYINVSGELPVEDGEEE